MDLTINITQRGHFASQKGRKSFSIVLGEMLWVLHIYFFNPAIFTLRIYLKYILYNQSAKRYVPGYSNSLEYWKAANKTNAYQGKTVRKN